MIKKSKSLREVKAKFHRRTGDDGYKPPKCGPSEGVEADAEGVDVKDAVQAATKKAIEVCALYKGCDDVNPKCLFLVKKVKVSDGSTGRQKATVSGSCECGKSESLPGVFV